MFPMPVYTQYCDKVVPVLVSRGDKIVSAGGVSGAKMNKAQRTVKIREKREREKRIKTLF